MSPASVRASTVIRSLRAPYPPPAASAPDRRALPIAGDDAQAKQVVTGLIDAFGFDVVDAGPLSEGWRFERAKPAYRIPLDVVGLTQALGAAERDVEVAHGSWRR